MLGGAPGVWVGGLIIALLVGFLLGILLMILLMAGHEEEERSQRMPQADVSQETSPRGSSPGAEPVGKKSAQGIQNGGA